MGLHFYLLYVFVFFIVILICFVTFSLLQIKIITMVFVIYKKLTTSQNKRVQLVQSTMSNGKHRNITIYITVRILISVSCPSYPEFRHDAPSK
jgi:hypothetical protein